MSAPVTEVAGPGAEREDRFRLAVLAASGPLLLLALPVVLPVLDERSLLAATRGHFEGLAILAAVFTWPLFVGALGLLRGRSRSAPGTAACAVPGVLHALGGMAAVILLGALLGERSRARESLAVWAAVAAALATVYVVARGARRRGWERWAQLVASVWLFHLMGVMVIGADGRGAFDPPEVGGWIELFALAAAAPAVGFILWPRRRG